MALTPYQRRLIELGLATPEEFGLEGSAVAELPIERFLVSPSAPEQAPAPEEEMGLIDMIRGVPGAISAGRRAADTTAAELERDLVGKGDDEYALTSNPRSPLAALGALYDVATTDKSLGEAYGDRITGNREELIAARREQTKAQEDVARIAEQSKFLRTVADASGSAPESILSTVGGVAGGLVGTAVQPGGGTAVGGIVGSSLGSIPMARKAFYAAWDEAFQSAKDAGLSEEAASSLADEQALEQASVEFGVEAVFGAIPGLRVGGTVLKRAAANAAGRTALEATSEAVTPFAQNLVRAGSAALEGDAEERAVISGMVKDWSSPELLEEAERGFLAGGLTSAAMITPLSGVEAKMQLDQEAEAQARVDRRRAMVDEAKTLIAQDKLRQQQELQEFAQRNETVAQAFQQGTLKQADLFDGLLNEELAPSVGGAREIEQAQRLEQEAADQVEARRVRNTVDEVDRAITEEAISRPDNIMANALFDANRDGRIANAVRPSERAAPEATPQAEPEQLGLGFRDPERENIEKLRRQAQARQRQEASKPSPAQKLDATRDKDRSDFQKNYLTVNPNASTEEVLAKTQEWSNTRDTLDSLRKTDTTLQAAEASVAEQLAKMDENKRKAIQRKEKNAFDQTVREMSGKGITDVTQIAQAAQNAINQVREASGLTTKAPQPTAAPAPAPTAPVTQPNLTPVSQPTQQAPAPLLDEDNQPLAMSYEDVLKRLDDTPEVTAAIQKVVPEKSAIEVDDGTDGEFDVTQIEEPDVRAQAEANPNLRKHLKGTTVRPVMYHGTRAATDIREWRTGEGQLGIHMTTNPQVAEEITRNTVNDPNARVLRLAPRITKALRLQDMSEWDAKKVAPQLVRLGLISQERADKAISDYADAMASIPNETKKIAAANQVTVDLIKETGHDGVVYVNRYEIPGLRPSQWYARLVENNYTEEDVPSMSDGEFKRVFPEADVSFIALESQQVKDVDRNSGEYAGVADIQAALPDEQAARAGKTTIGEINETYGEDVANLVEDYRNAKGPKQRVQALFDFLELTAKGRENAIIRTLLPLMKQYQSYIPDVVIETDKRLVKTSTGVDSLGYYNPNNGKLRLGMDGLQPRIVAHEILHALTWARIRDKEAVKADKNLAAAVTQLDDIRTTFQQWVDKNKGKHSGRLAGVLAPKKGGLVDADGKVDVDELITYGLTDPDVQKVLRDLPARGTLKNQWRKFVNFVRLAVGLDDSGRNLDALDSLLDATSLIVASSTQDNRAGVLEQYNDTMVDDVAKQARELAATPETTAPVEELTPVMIADRLSISTNALERSIETMQGKRQYENGKAPSVRVGIVDSFLPEGAQVEAIRQAIETRKGREVALEYDLVDTTAQEQVIKKYAEEAATIMKPGISKQEYDAAEAKIQQENPELFQAIVAVREKVRRNSLRIIKELYEASPVVDGKPNPSPATLRQINAIAANLGNYWTTVYQVHNKAEREQWQQIVRGTEEGQKILQNAKDFLMNDLTSFKVEDFATMPRARLERIHATWLGEADLGAMKKPELVQKLTMYFTDNKYDMQERAETVVTQAIRDLLRESGAKSALTKYFSRNRVGGGVLKERLEVPEPIAKLMGKIEDPLTVLYNTELAQGLLLEQLRFARSLKEQYTGVYFFPTQEEALAMGVADAVELRGPSMGALGGMWTAPGVQEMFAPVAAPAKDKGAIRQWVENILPTYAGVFKFTNLVLNPALMIFNGIGSISMAIANGVGPTYLAKAGPALMGTTVANLQALRTGKYNQQTYDMYRNMLADTPIAEAMRRRPLEQAIDNLRAAGALADQSTTERLGSGLKQAYADMWTLYSGMDLAAKLVVYYKQLDVLTEVNNALPSELRMTDDQVAERAAARTRQTTFSYELAAKMVRDLDRSGIFVFATYQYETFRSLLTSAYRAVDDVRLANDLRKAGHTEAASILAGHAAGRTIGVVAAANNTAIANTLIAKSLMGLAAMLGYGLSDDDEEEREKLEEAYRNIDKFSINKDVRVVGKIGNEYLVADVGRITDPYGPATELLGAVRSGDMERVGAATAALVSLNPLIRDTARLIGGQPAIPTAVRNDPEALAGYRAAGLNEPVTNFLANSLLTASGMGKQALVGAAKATPLLEDVDVVEEEATIEAPVFEMVTNNILKIKRFDPLDGITRIDTQELRNTRRDLNDVIKTAATLDEGTVRSLYLDMYEQEASILQDYVSMANAARVAGRTDRELATALKETQLSRAQQRYVLSPLARNYATSVLSESTLNALQEQELRAADSRERRREIVNKYNQLRRNLREIEKEIK